MRAVVQRCKSASVIVDDEVVSSIGNGICVFIGISRDDTGKDIEYMIQKLLSLKIYPDEKGEKWSCSVKDKQYEVLLISQFSLYCIFKGTKPNFHLCMEQNIAEKYYSDFVKAMKQAYSEEHVKDGKFGIKRQINVQHDGPVVINLECPREPVHEQAQSEKPEA
ncbi:D-tyrosyl-tRNA(Tyr) deacylase 1, partial [Stegodyphus mimosarum]